MSEMEVASKNENTLAKGFMITTVIALVLSVGFFSFAVARDNGGNILNLDEAQAQCVAQGGEVSITSGLLGKSYFCKGEDGIIRELSMRRA